MSQGMQGHFGFVKESTWGTAAFAPGSCTNFVELMSENIHVEIDRFETANVYGGIYERDDSAGIRRIAGQAAFAGHPQNLGYFLNAITGGNSTVTSIGATYTRTAFNFSTGDTSSLCPVPSYTVELYRDVTTAQIYTGVVVTQLAMNIAPNQDLRCTADILGKISSGSGNLKSTPTFPTSPTGPFTFDTASLAIGARAATNGHVLADGGDLLGERVLDRDVAELLSEERLDVRRLARQHRLGQVGGQRLEVGVLGDEVGLAVDLDHGGGIAVGGHADQALGGDAAGLLGDGGQALLAKPVDGGLEVAVDGAERLLAIHHARAGLLAELLHHLRGDLGHGSSLDRSFR